MNNFFGKTNLYVYLLHLRNGEDVLEEFLKFLQREKIKNGVVISGIGTLCACSFHGVVKGSLPAVDHFYKMENVSAEVSGMSGIIAEGQPHLHMVVTILTKILRHMQLILNLAARFFVWQRLLFWRWKKLR